MIGYRGKSSIFSLGFFILNHSMGIHGHLNHIRRRMETGGDFVPRRRTVWCAIAQQPWDFPMRRLWDIYIYIYTCIYSIQSLYSLYIYNIFWNLGYITWYNLRFWISDIMIRFFIGILWMGQRNPAPPILDPMAHWVWIVTLWLCHVVSTVGYWSHGPLKWIYPLIAWWCSIVFCRFTRR